MINPSQTITARFRVFALSGAPLNADSLPTGALYVDGVASAASVVVANVSTGIYTATVTVPSGVTARQQLTLEVTVTVAGVASAETVWRGTVADKAGYSLDAAYDAAKSAAQAGDEMGLTEGAVNAIAVAIPPPNLSPVKLVTDKLDTLLEETDTPDVYRLSATALENVPNPTVPSASEIAAKFERQDGMLTNVSRILTAAHPTIRPGSADPATYRISWTIPEGVTAGSVVLSDREGVYGVRRADTKEIVVEAGTEMLTEDGTTWYYDVESDGPAEFEYSIRVVEVS